jgi:DNA-directed RNA polymerase specialized sigma24 family protein
MPHPVDETQARLRHVPERHLAALRAALCGFEDAEIAALLDVPPEAVRVVLRLAAAKLVAALTPRRDQHPPADDPGAATRSTDGITRSDRARGSS